MYKDGSSSGIVVNVISMQGQRISLDVHSEMSVENVKDESIKKLTSTRGSGVDNSQEYVLIRAAAPFARLSNKNTVKNEELADGDFLMLYKCQKHEKVGEAASRAIPTMPGIKKATEGLPVRDKSSESVAQGAQSSGGNLEHTFRKILLTLLDLSYKLMFFDEEADGLFSKKKVTDSIDRIHLSSLTSMGFSEERACHALKLNHMDVEAAMDWLLQHPEEMKAPEKMDVADAGDNTDGESDTDVDRHSAKRVKRRLEGWQRKIRRLEPSSENVSILVGMGFSKEDCVQALRINGNNPNAACDWLLGDRKVPDDDPNDSLSPDSELYKAIVTNPTIHIGLHNKRVLEALEDMLENPMRRHNWANDSTVGSVILQILKLYHKYSTSGS